MSDIIETEVKEGATEYKTIVTPNFHEVAEEIARHVAYGWKLDPNRHPFYNFFLYEIHLIRDARTIAAIKETVESGREPITTEKRREIMANARAAKKINKGGQDES
jgi:hypothetical protein